MFALAAYLNLKKDTRISLKLPDYPKEIIITEEMSYIGKENNPRYLDSEQQILQSEQRKKRKLNPDSMQDCLPA